MRDVGISTPVGDDKVRINAASLVEPVVIQANESVRRSRRQAHAPPPRGEIDAWMNLDLSGLEDAGYGPTV